MQYEFISYGEDAAGAKDREVRDCTTISAARNVAGRIAKRLGGRVDLARLEPGEWADRYVTTASPCQYSTNGYRTERLDS